MSINQKSNNNSHPFLKGRGAQINPTSQYEKMVRSQEPLDWALVADEWLNGDVAAIFEDWIRKAMPDRADRVLNRIRDTHGGSLEEKRFGKRMRGEGNIAEIIHAQFRVAKEKYLKDRKLPPFNLNLHERHKSAQLSLF